MKMALMVIPIAILATMSALLLIKPKIKLHEVKVRR